MHSFEVSNPQSAFETVLKQRITMGREHALPAPWSDCCDVILNADGRPHGTP